MALCVTERTQRKSIDIQVTLNGHDNYSADGREVEQQTTTATYNKALLLIGCCFLPSVNLTASGFAVCCFQVVLP
jgi:hypothetical protein